MLEAGTSERGQRQRGGRSLRCAVSIDRACRLSVSVVGVGRVAAVAMVGRRLTPQTNFDGPATPTPHAARTTQAHHRPEGRKEDTGRGPTLTEGELSPTPAGTVPVLGVPPPLSTQAMSSYPPEPLTPGTEAELMRDFAGAAPITETNRRKRPPTLTRQPPAAEPICCCANEHAAMDGGRGRKWR